jgi:hypothetical protein
MPLASAIDDTGKQARYGDDDRTLDDTSTVRFGLSLQSGAMMTRANYTRSPTRADNLAKVCCLTLHLLRVLFGKLIDDVGSDS